MAAGAAQAFDFNSLAMGMGLGKASSDPGDGANEKDSIEFILEGAPDFFLGLGTKLGIQANLKDIQSGAPLKDGSATDLSSAKINRAAESMSLKGGFLARMLGALVRRGEITDHTQGIQHLEGGGGGGGDYAGGGGSSGGGGGDYSGGGMDYGSAPSAGGAAIEPMMVDYGGKQFAVASMSEGALGNLAPSSGVAPLDRGENLGMGA